MPRQLKTQNKGRNTVEVKVTLKPEIAKLLDAANKLKFYSWGHSFFILTPKTRLVNVGCYLFFCAVFFDIIILL